MCVVELPDAGDLDLSQYPIPRHGGKHEKPYFKQTRGGQPVVVANLLDDAQTGFTICLNLADVHTAATRHRQVRLLGERMVAVLEPHLLATRIQVQCMKLVKHTKGAAYEFVDGAIISLCQMRAQARLIVGRALRALKDLSGSEEAFRLALKEMLELATNRGKLPIELEEQVTDLEVGLSITLKYAGKADSAVEMARRQLAVATAKQPIDHAMLCIAESNLGHLLIATHGVGMWDGHTHISKSLAHQRLHFESVLASHKGALPNAGGADATGRSWSSLLGSEGREWAGMGGNGKLSLIDAASNLVSSLTGAADFEHLSVDFNKDLSGNDRIERMLLEAIGLARQYGDATKGRKAIISLANLYAGTAGAGLGSGGWGDWMEPDKEKWRIQQSALLRSELNEIAALTGRTVETDCCICLDRLEGDDQQPVYVIPTCFHRLHIECAKEQRRAQPKTGLMDAFVLKCPTCQ
jgi:hypothetical protein